MSSPRAGRLPALLVAGLAVALLAAWFSKARCLLDEPNWDAGEQYRSYCYTDIYPLYYAERLNEGAVPYFDFPVEYPVLTGAWMWASSTLASGFPQPLQGRMFLHLTMLAGALCLAGTVVLLRRMGVPSRRRWWMVASPAFVLLAFVNWDALPVLLTTAAIAAHRRGRDGWAGALAGLGAAAKLYPALLVPLVCVARARQRRWRDALVHAAAAAGAWLVLNGPVALLAPKGWSRFLQLSRTRPADHDSFYRLAEVYLLGGGQLDVATLNLVSAIAFAMAAAVVLAVGARRKAGDEMWQLLLPLVIAFLLTSKVYSPQFSLWLLPLLALGLPRLAPFVWFCLADLAVFLTRFSWLGGEEGFQPAVGFDAFAAAVAARAVVLLWIAWLAIRDRPAYLLRDASPAAASAPVAATRA